MFNLDDMIWWTTFTALQWRPMTTLAYEITGESFAPSNAFLCTINASINASHNQPYTRGIFFTVIQYLDVISNPCGPLISTIRIKRNILADKLCGNYSRVTDNWSTGVLPYQIAAWATCDLTDTFGKNTYTGYKVGELISNIYYNSLAINNLFL